MALRGTLKDFGIADIFQLIGHQGKAGRLSVRNRDQQVSIFFHDGHVIRAEPGSRQQKDLLGSMLTRAEILTQAELERALEAQKSTLKRLGEILIETTSLDRDTLTTFMKLQTTETIYKLFLWDSGTYEFKVEDVALAQDQELIRSEGVLMEGFRQVDEWPMIRKKITGYNIIFNKLEDLDELAAQESPAESSDDDPFGDLDDAFGDLEFTGGSTTGRLRAISDNEGLVYSLITPDRDVQKLIDLSRLGEFETCKSIVNLIEAKIIAPAADAEHKKPSATATVGGITSRQWPSARLAIRASLVIAVIVVTWIGAHQLGFSTSMIFTEPKDAGHPDTTIQEVLSRAQMSRLRQALAIYQSATGGYPHVLSTLVDEELVEPKDLTFPWDHEYYYAKKGDDYMLLRPLH